MIAAIQGGAYPPEANWIADRALRRLSTFDGLDELVPIAYDAGLELCELVAASKRTDTGNFYVEQAKRYLSTHLTQEIRVTEVADAIGLSPRLPQPTVQAHYRTHDARLPRCRAHQGSPASACSRRAQHCPNCLPLAILRSKLLHAGV